MRVPVVCVFILVLLAVSCTSPVAQSKSTNAVQQAAPSAAQSSNPNTAAEDSYTFTNELGQRINLADFKGQALALTFIFTRCPMPNYCPRLSKNFAEASKRLAAMPGVSTNWH